MPKTETSLEFYYRKCREARPEQPEVMGALLDACVALVGNREEALRFFRGYCAFINQCDDRDESMDVLSIARQNIGYIMGYVDGPSGAFWRDAVGSYHPVFGRVGGGASSE